MLNSKLLDKFDALQAKLQSSINFFNLNTIGKSQKKMYYLSTSPKCYCTLLKTLVNGRKFLFVPPLFHDNKFITDLKEKSSFFAKQCSLIGNGSALPSLFPLIIEKSLLGVDFSSENYQKHQQT